MLYCALPGSQFIRCDILSLVFNAPTNASPNLACKQFAASTYSCVSSSEGLLPHVQPVGFSSATGDLPWY